MHHITQSPYNRELIYKEICAPDGAWDENRILPDPVFNCAGGNLPPPRTVCNSSPRAQNAVDDGGQAGTSGRPPSCTLAAARRTPSRA